MSTDNKRIENARPAQTSKVTTDKPAPKVDFATLLAPAVAAVQPPVKSVSGPAIVQTALKDAKKGSKDANKSSESEEKSSYVARTGTGSTGEKSEGAGSGGGGSGGSSDHESAMQEMQEQMAQQQQKNQDLLAQVLTPQELAAYNSGDAHTRLQILTGLQTQHSNAVTGVGTGGSVSVAPISGGVPSSGGVTGNDTNSSFGDLVDQANKLNNSTNPQDMLTGMAKEEQRMLVLQMQMQQESQVYQALSNVLKTRNDTAKNAIGNIR